MDSEGEWETVTEHAEPAAEVLRPRRRRRRVPRRRALDPRVVERLQKACIAKGWSQAELAKCISECAQVEALRSSAMVGTCSRAQVEAEERAAKASVMEMEKLESSVEKDSMEVNKKQAAAAKQLVGLDAAIAELKPLQSRKTDMEAKGGSLEVALLAAIAGNSSELESAVNEMKMEMPAARKEGGNQTIEQIFEKLARLEKLVSLLIMRTEEMPSCTKQGMSSSEQISNAKELKAIKTILVNLAHPDKGTSLTN